MEPETKTSTGSKAMLPVSILIAGILIAGSIMYQPGSLDDKGAGVAPVGDARKASLTIGAAPVLGEANAPVTMIVFGDYQCPFCKNQADGVERQLREEYVKTGKLKIAFKHFPLENIHPQARPAAIAATCALAQNKFWEYHDALYEKQATLADINFANLAQSLGLNRTTFESCIKDPKISESVTKDLEEGIALGIRGTPASFVDNVYIEGAYPYKSFKEIIDAQLASKAK